MFSRFDVNNRHLRFKNLIFPHDLEQGLCTMYVHWPNYHPKSVFRSEIISLKTTEVEGQHIIRAPLKIAITVEEIKFFLFYPQVGR